METYWFPIHTAMIFFPLAAFVLTIPYMAYSYYKYGAVSWLRSLLLGSFLFYLMCAYFLVILPLPDPASVAEKQGPFTQLVPFTFIREFFQYTVLDLRDTGTFLPALKQSVFIQPVFNLLLTVPFGVYLSYYFKENLWKTILLTFLLSLFFELTQLTGLYGIYSKPYRLFDVDDLLLNTLGGLLGYFLGIGIARILPSKRRMDAASMIRSEHVGYLRRLVATGVDVVIMTTAGGIVGFLLPASGQWAMGIVYFLYFVGFQILTRGRTLGKMLVRIRVQDVRGDTSLAVQLLVKYGAVYLAMMAMQGGADLVVRYGVWWSSLLLLALGAGGFIYVVVDWAYSLRHGKRLWYERLSGTRNVNTFLEKGKEVVSQ